MTETWRVLVTGSRDWPDEDEVHSALNDESLRCAISGKQLVVVHGDCPTGADRMAREWCESMGMKVIEERHPADWDTYGKSAGPRRNREMVSAGADRCLAFLAPRSRGAAMTAAWVAEQGIPITIIRSPSGS